MAIDERHRQGRAEASRGLPLKLLSLAVVAAWAALSGESASAQAQASANAGAPRNPWRLQPSLSVGETYSDNISLAPAGRERSDLVTIISPGLRLTRYGSRLTLNLGYQPQFLYYARGTYGSTLRNYLDATAKATLVENLLFFDARAAVSQQNISPFGSLAANSVNGSANRAESRIYSLGPTLRSRFGNDLSYTAGYRYTGSSYSSNALGASRTSQVFGSVQSGTSFRDLGGGLTYNRSDQSYGGANRIIIENAGANLIYVLSPTIRLRAGTGYDRNRYPAAPGSGLSGPSYFGGFDWNPSRHTRLSAQVGRRYFGPTANIVFNRTTAHTSLSVSYLRDQTTSSATGLALVASPQYVLVDQLLRTAIPDPVLRAQAVAGILAQAGLSTYGTAGFLSNQLYLQKRFDVSLALLGLRNTVTLSAFRGESRVLSTLTASFDIFNQASSFRQTGFTVSWSHKLGPQTSANLIAQKIRNQAIVGSGETRQRILSASVNRQLQKNLSGALTYRNMRQDSANPVAGGFFAGSYRENAVFASLSLTF